METETPETPPDIHQASLFPSSSETIPSDSDSGSMVSDDSDCAAPSLLYPSSPLAPSLQSKIADLHKAFEVAQREYYDGKTGPYQVRGAYDQATYENWKSSVNTKWRESYDRVSGTIFLWGDPSEWHDAVTATFLGMVSEDLRRQLGRNVMDSGSEEWDGWDGERRYAELLIALPSSTHDVQHSGRGSTRKTKEPDSSLSILPGLQGAEQKPGLVIEHAYRNESTSALCWEVTLWGQSQLNPAQVCVGIQTVTCIRDQDNFPWIHLLTETSPPSTEPPFTYVGIPVGAYSPAPIRGQLSTQLNTKHPTLLPSNLKHPFTKAKSITISDHLTLAIGRIFLDLDRTLLEKYVGDFEGVRWSDAYYKYLCELKMDVDLSELKTRLLRVVRSKSTVTDEGEKNEGQEDQEEDEDDDEDRFQTYFGKRDRSDGLERNPHHAFVEKQ